MCEYDTALDDSNLCQDCSNECSSCEFFKCTCFDEKRQKILCDYCFQFCPCANAILNDDVIKLS